MRLHHHLPDDVGRAVYSAHSRGVLRDGTLVVSCLTCGALVATEDAEENGAHTRWHERLLGRVA